MAQKQQLEALMDDSISFCPERNSSVLLSNNVVSLARPFRFNDTKFDSSGFSVKGMDNNSLMLIDNRAHMDDQAHRDKDATDNNTTMALDPTTPIADADNGALLDPGTLPGKRRRKKIYGLVALASTKTSSKHCKKSFACFKVS